MGELVKAPGLPGQHRIDWLYSASGVSMEGEGIGLDGRMYHIDALGDGGWVTVARRVDLACRRLARRALRSGGPAATGATAAGGVTFPLQPADGQPAAGASYVPLRGVSFARRRRRCRCATTSRSRSIPSVIPLGSRVYIPAYRHDGHGGWFVAQDTGGAINGRHIDVYRSPPASADESAVRYLTGQRVYVIQPARSRLASHVRCRRRRRRTAEPRDAH